MQKFGPETSNNPVRTVAELASTITLFLFATTSVVQGNVIPTPSMEPTLLVGDHVLVDRTVFAPREDSLLGGLLPYREIERGDLIVFRYPLDQSELYVKRTAAVPGDRLRITGGRLYVNGAEVEEPYKVHRYPDRDLYGQNFPPERIPDGLPERGADMLLHHTADGELTVPEGMYFALGDNRDNSADSRYWGFVPRNNIVGTPSYVYWSFDAPSEQWLDRFTAKHLFDLALNLPWKTRWSRTLQPVPSARSKNP